MSDLKQLRWDVYACVFNYFLEGWKYRIQKEGYEAVAKDCDESAKKLIKQYEEALKEENE